MEIANQLSDNAEYVIVHGKKRYMSIYLFDLSLTSLCLLHCKNHSDQSVCHSCLEVVQTTSYQGGGIRGTR